MYSLHYPDESWNNVTVAVAMAEGAHKTTERRSCTIIMYWTSSGDPNIIQIPGRQPNGFSDLLRVGDTEQIPQTRSPILLWRRFEFKID